MKILGLFFSMLALAQADPLENELNKLSAPYAKFKGYQNHYQIEVPGGTTGFLKVGIDFSYHLVQEEAVS